MMMRRIVLSLIALATSLALAPARAAPQDEALTLYRQFAAAQKLRDLDKVRSLLLDSPRFLWVSDGKSIWGRDAVLKRMALFEEARVWHVAPALDKSTTVPVDDNAAFLHLPLELTLAFGEAPPEHLHFLVSVLCVNAPS